MDFPSKFWSNNKTENELLNKMKNKDEAIVLTINMFKGGVGKSNLTNMFGYIANRYDLSVKKCYY
ncbi:hypothetical protein JMUB7545_27410 [Staphylococcus aureus]